MTAGVLGITSSSDDGRAGLQVHVGGDLADPAWDAFVGRSAGGSYTQSSLWAQVKASARWSVQRIIVRRDGRIVGGAQVLIRGLPWLGGLGYVPRGSLVAEDDPGLMNAVLEALLATERRRRLHYLLVLPPYGQARCVNLLQARGFRPSAIEPAPTSTIMLDLSRSLEELLGAMKGKTRYNVRLGLRKGIVVRSGDESDLGIFHELLVATGLRKGFSAASLAYYQELWRVFSGCGRLKLFLAQAEGKPVAGLLAVAFGDTVTYWRGAWAGECGALHPNEALHWRTIEWAKQEGYRWYDLDGIVPGQVEGVLGGRADTAFKVGYGGERRMVPGAFEHIVNPALRWGSSIFLSKGAQRLKSKLAAAIRGSKSVAMGLGYYGCGNMEYLIC